MNAVKVRIQLHESDESVIPIMIPKLEDVRAFATQLHIEGKPWQGEAFGWRAEYNPERSEPPLDSRMTFTPADFCIGESGLWFFSLLWEDGKDAAPQGFVDDRKIVKESNIY